MGSRLLHTLDNLGFFATVPMLVVLFVILLYLTWLATRRQQWTKWLFGSATVVIGLALLCNLALAFGGVD